MLNYLYIKDYTGNEELSTAIYELVGIMRYNLRITVDRVSLEEEIRYMAEFIDLY